MTQLLHSRLTLLVAIIVATALAWLSAGIIPATAPSGWPGLVTTWTAPWHLSPSLGLWIALALNAATAMLLSYLNKAFNLLRSLTWLPGTIFIFMQLAVPASMAVLGSGIVVCLVTIVCLYILYGSYDNVESERQVFTIFLLQSMLAAIDCTALVLMPIFWLGCGQMRILSLRTVLASLFGIATPWVILFGFGIVSADEIAISNPFGFSASVDSLSRSGILGVAAFTVFLALCAWIQGFMKLITYNAKTRSMIGIITVLMLMSMLLCVAALKSIGSWLPLLNCCAALHVGHLFGAVHRQKKSFIVILVIILIYLAFYAWRLATCWF